MANGFADVQEIFAEYDYDLAKLGAAAAADPELTQRLEAFGGEEFTAASERVSTYLGGVQPAAAELVSAGVTSRRGG